MKILNMVIPILMERFKLHKTARHTRKYDIINDVKLFDILLQIFEDIQSDIMLQNQVH